MVLETTKDMSEVVEMGAIVSRIDKLEVLVEGKFPGFATKEDIQKTYTKIAEESGRLTEKIAESTNSTHKLIIKFGIGLLLATLVGTALQYIKPPAVRQVTTLPFYTPNSKSTISNYSYPMVPRI